MTIVHCILYSFNYQPANTFLASAVTSLLLISPSITALFSTSSLFSGLLQLLQTLVTSASEVTVLKLFSFLDWFDSFFCFFYFFCTFCSSGRHWFDYCSCCCFLACFPASRLSTTVIKASTLACSASISNLFAVSFARTTFAAVNTSLR